jgi:hypothetical protein
MRLCALVTIVKQERQAKSSLPPITDVGNRPTEIADATTATSQGKSPSSTICYQERRFVETVRGEQRPAQSAMVETTHLFALPAMRTIDLVGGDGGGAAAIE